MENSVKSLNIKIGRVTYSFEDGHTFYDNGNCIQSQTFRVYVDKWSTSTLKITKGAWVKIVTSCKILKHMPNGDSIWVLRLADATAITEKQPKKLAPSLAQFVTKEEPKTEEPKVENKEAMPVITEIEVFNCILDSIVKNNIGEKVAYKKNGTWIVGFIKGLMFDKRVNAEYYRVLGTDDKIYHVRTNNKNIFKDA